MGTFNPSNFGGLRQHETSTAIVLCWIHSDLTRINFLRQCTPPRGPKTLFWFTMIVLHALPMGCGYQAETSRQKADRVGTANPITTDAISGPANDTSTNDKPLDGQNSLFRETTLQLGIAACGGLWPRGTYLAPETGPSGVALLDFDGDGDLDIYQLCHPPPESLPSTFTGLAPNRLYRQEADGGFVEVAKAVGLDDAGYGYGVAVGDVDNDGDLDIFVSNYGLDALYLNNADGTYRKSNGHFGDASWSTGACFFDKDQDGDLDLFVTQYAQFDPNERCRSQDDYDEFDYCGPHIFPGLADRLFENNGQGQFNDISQQTGITVAARGWGAICTDLTGDSWPDIYVANDLEPNQLWVNQKDGTFVDQATLRGVAFNAHGKVEASMGLAAGDVDQDGRLDLFMTHLSTETNTLYTTRDAGDAALLDRSSASGMAVSDLPYTGWGCALFDVDHDQDLDVAVVNGRVARGAIYDGANADNFWNHYAEPNLLFRNDGTGKFTNAKEDAGSFCRRVEVTRALAVGDLDSDGDLDLVISNIDNTLRIYENQAPSSKSHWLMVRALFRKRDAIGAHVQLNIGKKPLVGLILPGASYLSSHDPRAHFGLGAVDNVETIEVLWPTGQRERFPIGKVDRVVVVRQGEGTSLP